MVRNVQTTFKLNYVFAADPNDKLKEFHENILMTGFSSLAFIAKMLFMKGNGQFNK